MQLFFFSITSIYPAQTEEADRSEQCFLPCLICIFLSVLWVSEVTVIFRGGSLSEGGVGVGEYNPTHYAYSREEIWAQRWRTTPWVICKTWAMAPERHADARVRWLSHRCTMGGSLVRRHTSHNRAWWATQCFLNMELSRKLPRSLFLGVYRTLRM